MRRLNHLASVGAVAVGAVLLVACGGGSEPGDTPAVGLVARTVEVGEVIVKVAPQRIDGDGAEFAVVFDTHSVELDLDIAANASLVVDGIAWSDAAWEGAGPGGHHREGTLRFTPAGEPAGAVALTIDGLDEPVEAAWDLEGR